MLWNNKDKADAEKWRAHCERERETLKNTRAKAVFHIEMVDGDMLSFEVDKGSGREYYSVGCHSDVSASYIVSSMFTDMQTAKHGIIHDNTFIPLHMIKTITMDDIEEYEV